jgi:ribose/xylose/arabinose/galactoside ABC-type transport system permease subunit
MVFEDSSQPGVAGSRYLGEGFRQEPDFRDGGATPFQVSSEAATGENDTVTLARRIAPPNLDYVFDDPAEGEPGRDRMLVHGLWELFLLVAVVGVGFLLYRQAPGTLTGDGLRATLLGATALGALAAGLAVALRAGAPNLAVGPVAVAAALQFGHNAGGGLLRPLLVVIGLCAVIGAVQGIIVAGLQVPGWAVSLGVAFTVLVWSNGRAEVSAFGGYDPKGQAYWWFGAFAAMSVAACAIGAIPAVRRAIGRFRPVADPARRRGPVAGLITVGALVASTVLAGVAGVVMVATTRSAAPSGGFELTALALGAALLGGTSAFGRRGGVFGTVLAVSLLTVCTAYAAATDRSWPAAAFAAVAIGLGLAVTRLVERFGRPAVRDGDETDDEDDWVSRAHSSLPNGRTWQPSSTASGVGGLWASDDAWGSVER